jgi:hypothetical protein
LKIIGGFDYTRVTIPFETQPILKDFVNSITKYGQVYVNGIKVNENTVLNTKDVVEIDKRMRRMF